MSAPSRSPPDGGGPFEDAPWPTHLTGRVVDGGPLPRVHGYDVQGDLARHYRYGDLLFLAMTGELPSSPQVSAAFEVVLAFVAVAAPAEAPTHAAIIARTCNAPACGILGTAAVGLAEQARWLVAEHAELLDWLDAGAPRGAAPAPALHPASDADRAALARLRGALAGTVDVPLLSCDASLDASLLAALHACGLRDREILQSVIVAARFPIAAAEALSHPPMGFRDYPMNVPPITYVEDP